MFSVVAVVSFGFYLFQNTNPELWKISGLLVGVYTGGTPNLASLKLMLDVDEKHLFAHSLL